MKDPMRIDLDEIKFSPPLFSRPECLLCCATGDMFASHKGAGVLHVSADGGRRVLGAQAGLTDTERFLANGIALAADGTLLIANILGDGGIWRIGPDGVLLPHLMEADGVRLIAANFVMLDHAGRMWITCSTRSDDRSATMNHGVADGFVVLADARGARIVADGLAFTNECRVDSGGTALYVCETAGRRVSRFAISVSGDLGLRQMFAEFPAGTYPDGCAFDAAGHLWVASPISNRVIRVAPDGTHEIVLEDVTPGHIENVETARARGRFARDHFYAPSGRRLNAITSVAFGGADLRTVYLGSLTSDRVASFRSDVPGEPLPHWTFRRRAG